MATTTTVIATELPEAANLFISAIEAAGGTITSKATGNPIRFKIERPKKRWIEGSMAYRGTATLTASRDRQTRVELGVRLPFKTIAAFTIGVLGCVALGYMGYS